MKKLILTTAFLLSILSVHAQEFFSDKRPVQSANQFTKKVNDISYDIDLIIKNNKEKLKQDLNEIDQKVESNQLTKAEADKLRNEKAEFYAKRIEEETKIQEDKIKVLINNKIEDNINFSTDMSAYQKQLVENKSLFYLYYGISKNFMLINDDEDYYHKKAAVTGFEVGFGVKTRLGQDLSRLYWNSSLNGSFQNFRINNNKTLADVNNETVLVDVGFPVKKSNFSISEIRLENYLEYDFSKRKTDEFGNTLVKSRQSIYAGLGGFIGWATLTKNLQYEIDGEKYKESTQSRYNSNAFTYGVGGYVGYRGVNLKATYNLNQVFKKSFADQNVLTVSLIFNLL